MERIITASQKYQKEANRTLIMNVLKDQDHTSRADLSRITGLKRSTITHMIAELQDCGILEEGELGTASPQGGRRPTALRINAGAAHIIGIDIDRYRYHAVLLDLNGCSVDSCSRRIEEGSPAAEYIPRIISDVYEVFKTSHTNIMAIGVGISGSVDPTRGILMESRLHELNDHHLYGSLEDIDIPVVFENDANCCAWAELYLGSGRMTGQNGIFVLPRVTCDREGLAERIEMGGAVIVDRSVWHGSRFITGEFSMNSWFLPGYEKVGLSRASLLHLSEDQEILRDAISLVLQKLIGPSRMLDPDRIILGGIFSDQFALVEQVLEQEFRNTWFQEEGHAQRVVPSGCGSSPIASGAAAYVLSLLYRMPNVGDACPPFDISWGYVVSSAQRGT